MANPAQEQKPLDARERRFVDEYLIDLDPQAAAVRAGYAKTTAHSKSYDWVCESGTKPHVFAAIQEAMADRSERTKIDADWVLDHLSRLTETSIADFLVIPDGGGMPHFDLSGASPEQLAAIEGLQLDTHRQAGEDGGTVEKIKLTLPGKLKTLELIGKHVGVQAFADRKEIGGIGGGPVQVRHDLSNLTDEELNAIERILGRATADD